MRRQLHVLTLLTAIAAPAGLAQVADVAQAQTLTAAKIESVDKAVESFLVLAKDYATSGQAPRYSDPATKALLDTAFDTKDLRGKKPLPWSSMGMLQQWNQSVQRIGLVYYLAGTGTTTAGDAAKDPKKVERANKNTAIFANEFGRYYDAQLRIHSAMIDTGESALAAVTPEQKKDPAFRKTLIGISASAANTMTGVLGAFVLNDMTDDWMLLRLVTLLEMTAKAAKYMSPEDRLQVKTAAHEVSLSAKNPDVKSGLNIITRAFEMIQN